VDRSERVRFHPVTTGNALAPSPYGAFRHAEHASWAAPSTRRAALREILLWWLVSRAVVMAGVLVLAALDGPGGHLGRSIVEHPFRLLEAWDGRWYVLVAQHGYLSVPGQRSDPAFFPFFPALMHAGNVAGIGAAGAGVLIANLVFPLSLIALYELGCQLLPEPLARRAAVYASVFPVGFAFSMAYPQSLVLLAVALAGVLAIRGQWIGCAVCLGLGTLARPECFFVVVPVGVLVAQRWRVMPPLERGKAVGALLAGPTALLSFPLYLGWTIHDPWAWSRAQAGWGRSFQLDGPLRLAEQLPQQLAQNPWLVRDVVAVGVYAWLFVVARRAGVPLAWVVAGALVVAVPLMSGSVMSEARFGLLAPALYWGLASATATPRRYRIGRSACLVLLAIGTLTLPFVFP